MRGLTQGFEESDRFLGVPGAERLRLLMALRSAPCNCHTAFGLDASSQELLPEPLLHPTDAAFGYIQRGRHLPVSAYTPAHDYDEKPSAYLRPDPQVARPLRQQQRQAGKQQPALRQAQA